MCALVEVDIAAETNPDDVTNIALGVIYSRNNTI